MVRFYTKDELIKELLRIREIGWIKSIRKGKNDAAVGNTLEQLLGIEENNLPIPNAGEWELKVQRETSNSLVTLFHMEPSPRGAKIVPNILLPLYGWRHEKAGTKYPENEMSFRSTTRANKYTDRGFIIIVNRDEKKIEFSFNAEKVSEKHRDWLEWVRERVGHLNDFDPRPYWGFADLEAKARDKIKNMFFVLAKTKREGEYEYFLYDKIFMLSEFSFENFLKLIEEGIILIDFDARTGHNHGTKFRMRRKYWPRIFNNVRQI